MSCIPTGWRLPGSNPVYLSSLRICTTTSKEAGASAQCRNGCARAQVPLCLAGRLEGASPFTNNLNQHSYCTPLPARRMQWWTPPALVMPSSAVCYMGLPWAWIGHACCSWQPPWRPASAQPLVLDRDSRMPRS